MFRRNDSLLRRQQIAAASALLSPGGVVIPVLPLITTSGVPSTAVATMGLPIAIDSIATMGKPSKKEGRTVMSANASQSATFFWNPTNRTTLLIAIDWTLV